MVFVHYIIQYKNLKIEINFHAPYFFFGELKDQLLSTGGGKGRRILRIIWFLGEGGGGGISRLQQNFKGDFRSFTANGGGGKGRGLKNTTELMGGSGKFYHDKTKILRPLSP